MADGYLVLPAAVDPGLADRIATTMTNAFERGDERLRYQGDSDETHAFQGHTDPRKKRVVEAHAVLPEVRDAFASPQLVEFLTALFEEPAVLSQSLMFQMGSEQPIHRDTTFVQFDQPLCMVGCWIALEDVRPGSGELSYIVGSHRLPDFPFSTGKKAGVGANPDELHASFGWLLTESDKRGLTRQSFRARKGDVLVWHADLAHGGSPITDPRLTRQSVVGHLSPYSVGRSTFAVSAIRRQHGPIHYSSTWYDLTA
ncbi:MAG TPA: phytanoyl-CoA dioxygenase family protein [Usitatibacter sp.]|nr:phytanoyl-CoA dioxygenase family protein [Usitatibacter sp.]